MEEMTVIEIARKFAEMGEKVDACRAYAIVANDSGADPEERMEAAIYILQAEDNYHISYLCFVDLYAGGHFREEILGMMTEAFYLPNVKELKNRYERNVRLLKKYPYLFRKDFPEFGNLPVRFFPFDEGQYFPFFRERFGELVIPGEKIIRHHFFADLEKPVLADDIFSQYELEYLRDNVRKSEDLGRENHIYLHYADWGVFCSYMQVLNLRPLLEDKKLVFLIEDELSEYPIDFKERFGIDYARYPLKPVGVREISRLIWHTQLSTHNGGDFFNEIFDAHPNLLCIPSIFLKDMEEIVATVREGLETARNIEEAQQIFALWQNPRAVEEVYYMRRPTDKDLMIALYKYQWKNHQFLDPASRIVPAVFFQPHFSNVASNTQASSKGYAISETINMEVIRSSSLFRDFKYIKTFTPLRRFTTSYGGSVRFMYNYATGYGKKLTDGEERKPADILVQRILNRSFMRDPDEPLYKDSIIVSFENGKLNPKATFTALSAFLDIPYTDSMTYCSECGKRDPHADWVNYAAGFNLSSVYKTYDDFASDDERRFIEYFLRDAYEYYGYDFHYYNGEPVDHAELEKWFAGFGSIDRYMRETQLAYWEGDIAAGIIPPMTEEEKAEKLDAMMKKNHKIRWQAAEVLQQKPLFVNKRGEPMRMTPMLQLDPKLLERELYH